MLGRRYATCSRPGLRSGREHDWLASREGSSIEQANGWTGRGRLTDPAAVFAGMMDTEIELLEARDPETKGGVERMNRFFCNRSMPDRVFASPECFNTQLAAWLSMANARMSRSRRGRPAELVAADRVLMRGLPQAAPQVEVRNSVRTPRDYYVRLFSNDHSGEPTMIDRLVDEIASQDTVTVHREGVLIADHRRRWARQLTVTDPSHVTRAAALRFQFQAQHQRHPPSTVATS